MVKTWYQSKTMWTAVVTAVVAVLQAAGLVSAVPEVAWQLLAAFGLYGVRDAIQ